MTMLRIALVASLLAAQSQYPFNERPADVGVTFANSPKLYDGKYRLSGIARVCGEMPKELNFSGLPAFVVHFYADNAAPVGGVQDVTFDSNELVGGVTKTSKFRLSVTVRSATRGSPPAYVIDPRQPKTTGQAVLTQPAPGTIELNVSGSDPLGATVNLTLVCKPKKSA